MVQHQLVDKPFDDESWVYEVKWDGHCAVTFVKSGYVELKSRNDRSFNGKFYPISAARLYQLGANCA
ncbi:MAG: hypothetical protein LBV59_10480 [Sphingobacterium sp.]|uniref:hypothetical protein n=1 Tax=Sphingobacterium sp. TaxID=341027 RepID=UPI00284BDC18|nr:hypothetical protein [Sphingobacterium sp.]MDR3008351.1 hypothetical protein [Sphingobacterium sp.]